MEDMTSHSPLLTYGTSTGTLHNHTSQSANGSIITMTLKNNHLIVETEERGVRFETGGTKTTTTKFSASASPHQNGVFVVEVQQGGVAAASAAGASAGGAGAAGSQPYAPSTALFAGGATAGAATGADAQRAQVHRPPEIEIDDADDIADIDDVDDDEEDEAGRGRGAGAGAGAGRRFGSTNTGLSQSDLSMSSAGSNNPSYRYGNQVGYESGHFGYPQYSGYSVGEDGGDAEDVVIAMEMAHAHAKAGHAPGIGGHRVDSVDYTLAYGPLMSDSQALKRCQDAKAEAEEEDVHQEEQRQLGNGGGGGGGTNSTSGADASAGPQRKGSLPPRLAASGANDDAAALAEERLSTVAELPAPAPTPAPAPAPGAAPAEDASLRGKRASLPNITPDLYKQTKSLLLDKGARAAVAPKFERLRDEADEADGGGGGGGTAASTTMAAPSSAAGGGGGGGGGSQYENRAFVSAEHATS
ncbi:hypothetical protein R5R35_013897 [Gryllus longicercus]|uniref:Uncharacterized protein n=1 Tax=Gryllus longicercus TaxID=2509291 RepID=A0AAN9VQE4_9ORTH